MAFTPPDIRNRIEQARREGWAELDLSGNPVYGSCLFEFPQEILQLSALERLVLRNNRITFIPEELRQLPALRRIDLRGNPLKSLPDMPGLVLDEKDYLRLQPRLSPAHIAGLRLRLARRELPAYLKELPGLYFLDLSGNYAVGLPSEIGKLEQLRELELRNNLLTCLPDFLGNFEHLTSLDVSGNQLTSLPDFLGNFEHLTSLDVGGNQLTSLPDFL
ncbi:MAG: leucine-rich repeat domain-containing protein, partial [Calditrichaeota bacterium]|nr:leucine-rich repeat domain-containing protein [Calditrichota bacterium]